MADPGLLSAFAENPEQTWASIYDTGPEPHCFADLYNSLAASDLIVGFEIPPFMKRAFAASGLDYVSLHLHPVRFLKDFTFSAYTNAADLASSLAAISCEPHSIAHQVARFRARLEKFHPVQAQLPDGIPMLFGQTAVDSSLIAQGRFMRIQDYDEPLAALLDGHTEVAFLKHPLAQWRHEDIRFLTRELGKTLIGISGNSYAHIMSRTFEGRVATISSSLGVEATLFGHDCSFLLANPLDKFAIPELDDPRHVQLDHRLFEPLFWQTILERTGNGMTLKPDYRNSFHLGADYVRGTLQDSSLDGLEGTSPLPPMQKLIIPAADAPLDRVDAIAGHLAGADLHDRKQAIVQASHHQIDLKIDPEPVAHDRSWTWDSSIAMPELYLSGFYPVEDQGAWAGKTACTMTVPLSGSDDLNLTCEASVSFFAGIRDQYPALLVRVQGKPVSVLFQAETAISAHTFFWEVPVKVPGPCVIEFECSHSARPNEPGRNIDERCLSFMLHRVIICGKRGQMTGEPQTPCVWGLSADAENFLAP
ncbi:uncharacterized protein PY1_contig-18-11 [Novosphingobium sp. PY1]|nr:uncharacterized protein PY1_contig-18-11 [Novosphingobium sp. PY1]